VGPDPAVEKHCFKRLRRITGRGGPAMMMNTAMMINCRLIFKRQLCQLFFGPA